MKKERTPRARKPFSASVIALALFFLFLLVFGALILRYGLGMSLKEKYLRGPAQGMTIHGPHTCT